MNWGDNPIVSNMLHKEYNDAIEELSTGDVEIDMPRINPKESLAQLRDRGFTARMLSRSDLSWKKAVRQFGVRSLVEFGVDWEMALEMGLQLDDLQYMDIEQLHKMNATADSLVIHGATADTFINMKASAADMINLGFTTPLLEYIGCNSENMHKLGIDQATLDRLDPREKISMEPRVTAYDAEYTCDMSASESDTGGTDNIREIHIGVLPEGSLLF